MGHMRPVRQASASFECCRDTCFGLIGRHADVDVGPATPRLGRAEATREDGTNRRDPAPDWTERPDDRHAEG
jgi:hypothetical protein